MRAMRDCEGCGHRFPQRTRGWNAVDVRYERCPRCGHENGYESDLYRWLRLRREGIGEDLTSERRHIIRWANIPAHGTFR